VRERLSDPDPIRLRYAKRIHGAVADIVRNKLKEPLGFLEKISKQNIPETHQEAFTQIIMDDLRCLHEGVLARYGLRPSELDSWRDFLSAERSRQN
jgi:hypothetical protein